MTTEAVADQHALVDLSGCDERAAQVAVAAQSAGIGTRQAAVAMSVEVQAITAVILAQEGYQFIERASAGGVAVTEEQRGRSAADIGVRDLCVAKRK